MICSFGSFLVFVCLLFSLILCKLGGTTETVAPPVISGTTPFDESTEVTITGPAGADIRYSTDGHNPTRLSTLYTAPFTLTTTRYVTAIAIKNGVSSTVAAKWFNKRSDEDNEQGL